MVNEHLGRLVFHNTPEGAIQYQYDVHSRQTSVVIGPSLYVDAPLTSFTPQRSTLYTYDQLGRLQTVREVVHDSDAVDPDEHQCFYDLLGSLNAELSSSGLCKDYVYDSMQRLVELTHYRTDGTLADVADLSDNPRLVRFEYTLRDDGRRIRADEAWFEVGSATQSTPLEASYDFSYDNLGRLTDEVFDHWDDTLDYHDSFTYEPAGNRVQKSRDALSDGTAGRLMREG